MKVKKSFLKPLAIFMAICMLVALGGITSAYDETETEIIVHDVDCPQKAQQIINSINGNVAISPASIFCIFGHSLATGAAIMTEHRVWATAPRCVRTTFDVRYCTRNNCNFITHTVRSTTRIYCC